MAVVEYLWCNQLWQWFGWKKDDAQRCLEFGKKTPVPYSRVFCDRRTRSWQRYHQQCGCRNCLPCALFQECTEWRNKYTTVNLLYVQLKCPLLWMSSMYFEYNFVGKKEYWSCNHHQHSRPFFLIFFLLVLVVYYCCDCHDLIFNRLIIHNSIYVTYYLVGLTICYLSLRQTAVRAVPRRRSQTIAQLALHLVEPPLSPFLTGRSVCSPNILRTFRPTILRFLTGLQWDASFCSELAAKKRSGTTWSKCRLKSI